MAARIVWWMLTLGILTVFHLPVTKEQKEQSTCRPNVNGCFICKKIKATKDDCLHRFCVNKVTPPAPVCIKHDYKEDLRNCGIPPPENIVGGSQTNEGNWPWQVSLQTNTYNHVCEGVLIDNDWVLTAAHCVHKSNAKDLIVVHGNLTRKSAKGKFRRIKHIFVHPKFQARLSYPNDVALIQMENDADYSEYALPICLPTFGDVISPNSCSITGWAAIEGGDKTRLHVQKVTPDECGKRMWGKTVHFCVNYAWTDTYFGDDGGALSCVRNSDGKLVVTGVRTFVSFFPPQRRYIKRYTNIRIFMPWINKIIQAPIIHHEIETT